MTEQRWVYVYLDANDSPLYVGCSNNVEQRHEAHRGTEWFPTHVTLRTFGPFTRRLAFQMETALIVGLNPPGNVMHTDRDPRKATNWTINLGPGPYRLLVGGTATHFTRGYGISVCGSIRRRANAQEIKSEQPATCRSCLRHVSRDRQRDGLLAGETWVAADRRRARAKKAVA